MMTVFRVAIIACLLAYSSASSPLGNFNSHSIPSTTWKEAKRPWYRQIWVPKRRNNRAVKQRTTTGGTTTIEQQSLSFKSASTNVEPVSEHVVNATKEAKRSSSGSSSSSSILVTLSTGISSLFQQHGSQLTRYAWNGVQLGIVAYLIKAIWQATSEVLEELHLEAGGTDSSPYFRPHAISDVIQDLRANKHDAAEAHPVLFGLAQKLHASGLPLVSPQEGHGDHNSVEKVLCSLARKEINLLQQCLWTPSSSSPNNHVSLPMQLWRSIKGLPYVQEALLDRIQTIRVSQQARHSSHHHNTNPYSALLATHSSGVLLYGPPGCGKSLLIQALATTARIPFLVITPSVLLRKYVGETNLQIRTLFELATKLSPCILCLDELDGLFRERRADEHDVSRESKTEFLQFWDGILRNKDSQILIVGATNRPFDVDAAVLRRMPQSHFVGLPMAEARHEILSQLLHPIPKCNHLDIQKVVQSTEGYSPSDLVQLVQTAVQSGPMREARRQQPPHAQQQYRALSMQDLQNACMAVGPTPLSAHYSSALVDFVRQHQPRSSPPIVGQQQQQQQQQQSSVPQRIPQGPWGDFIQYGGTVEAPIVNQGGLNDDDSDGLYDSDSEDYDSDDSYDDDLEEEEDIDNL